MKQLSIYAGMAITALALLLQGCVGNKKYNALRENYDAILLKEREVAARYQDVQRQLSSANTRVQSLEDQIASERANVKALQEALNQCLASTSQGNVNISKLVDEINASNRYIQHLVNATGARLSAVEKCKGLSCAGYGLSLPLTSNPHSAEI